MSSESNSSMAGRETRAPKDRDPKLFLTTKARDTNDWERGVPADILKQSPGLRTVVTYMKTGVMPNPLPPKERRVFDDNRVRVVSMLVTDYASVESMARLEAVLGYNPDHLELDLHWTWTNLIATHQVPDAERGFEVARLQDLMQTLTQREDESIETYAHRQFELSEAMRRLGRDPVDEDLKSRFINGLAPRFGNHVHMYRYTPANHAHTHKETVRYFVDVERRDNETAPKPIGHTSAAHTAAAAANKTGGKAAGDVEGERGRKSNRSGGGSATKKSRGSTPDEPPCTICTNPKAARTHPTSRHYPRSKDEADKLSIHLGELEKKKVTPQPTILLTAAEYEALKAKANQ